MKFGQIRTSIAKTFNAWSPIKNEGIYQAFLETPQKANLMWANTTKAPYLGNLASLALCAKAIWPLYLSPETSHREGLFAGVLEFWSGGQRRCVQMEAGAKSTRGRAVLTTGRKLDPGLTLTKQWIQLIAHNDQYLCQEKDKERKTEKQYNSEPTCFCGLWVCSSLCVYTNTMMTLA